MNLPVVEGLVLAFVLIVGRDVVVNGSVAKIKTDRTKKIEKRNI